MMLSAKSGDHSVTESTSINDNVLDRLEPEVVTEKSKDRDKPTGTQMERRDANYVLTLEWLTANEAMSFSGSSVYPY